MNIERGVGEIQDELLKAAIERLSQPGHPISTALEFVPPRPGLYAIGAKPEVWTSLGLDARGPGVPLYVGKSESSMVDRDLKEHFGIDPEDPPNTGSSTVRRSFAALLRERLELQGVPRNKENPERPTNYGLEDGGDPRLTSWMQAHLTLVCWPRPQDLDHLLESEREKLLGNLEEEIIKHFDSPINIHHAPTGRSTLRAARALMATEAKAWISRNSS